MRLIVDVHVEDIGRLKNLLESLPTPPIRISDSMVGVELQNVQHPISHMWTKVTEVEKADWHIDPLNVMQKMFD